MVFRANVNTYELCFGILLQNKKRTIATQSSRNIKVKGVGNTDLVAVAGDTEIKQWRFLTPSFDGDELKRNPQFAIALNWICQMALNHHQEGIHVTSEEYITGMRLAILNAAQRYEYKLPEDPSDKRDEEGHLPSKGDDESNRLKVV